MRMTGITLDVDVNKRDTGIHLIEIIIVLVFLEPELTNTKVLVWSLTTPPSSGLPVSVRVKGVGWGEMGC